MKYAISCMKMPRVQDCAISVFAGKVMMSYSSKWFKLLLLCTSAPLVLCCDQFDCGSRQVKREPVDLVMEDYDVSLASELSKAVLLNWQHTCKTLYFDQYMVLEHLEQIKYTHAGIWCIWYSTIHLSPYCSSPSNNN